MLEKSKISYLNTQTFALQNLQGIWTPTCPVQVSNLPCPGQRVFLEICPVSCPEQGRFCPALRTPLICTMSISSHCNQKCGRAIHVPPCIAIYDGHIHLNQPVSQLQSDLLFLKEASPVREFHFINNNHKPGEWLTPNLSFSSHVHVYSTFGIHPKYFKLQSIYQNLSDLQNRLQISATLQDPHYKLVALGESGLDDTSMASIDQQMFMLEKQIDLATKFNVPFVLHCHGYDFYRKLFHYLKQRIFDRNLSIHWHCINSNANLNVVDVFLHEFPNSYIGINGSITYETNTESASMFENWLVNRCLKD